MWSIKIDFPSSPSIALDLTFRIIEFPLQEIFKKFAFRDVT